MKIITIKLIILDIFNNTFFNSDLSGWDISNVIEHYDFNIN